MPEVNQRTFYAERAARALELSKKVTDPKIAAIHQRMAASYKELVELTPPDDPFLRGDE